jgi:hypothetical protein
VRGWADGEKGKRERDGERWRGFTIAYKILAVPKYLVVVVVDRGGCLAVITRTLPSAANI